MVLRSRVVALVATVLALLALVTLGTLVPSGELPRMPAELEYPPLPPAPEAGRELVPVAPVRREEARVEVAGESLAATVFAPVSSAGQGEQAGQGPYPAMVFVHGSGAGERDAFADQAQRLAGSGMVTLVYDKRTAGYSVFQRDYAQLADDALAAVRLLRERSDVDPARVGLWGISEGGWVVAIGGSAAASEVAFVIMVSAAATTPLQQSTWALDGAVRRLGAPGGARRAVVRAFGVGGFDYVRHDPQPPLEAMGVPLLAIYGTQDRAVPPVESARLLVSTLADRGNLRCTVRFFEGADHDLRVDGELAPGYLETVATWVHGLPATGTPEERLQVAGATPTQARLSLDVSPTSYGLTLLLVVYALIIGGYLAAPVYRLVAWLRRRELPPLERPRLCRRLRQLGALGLATVLALNAYLVTVLVLAAVQWESGAAAWVTTGWLAVRVLAVLTTALLVSTVVIAVSTTRAGWRPRGLERVRVTGVCVATAAALLLACYWGLFAPRW